MDLRCWTPWGFKRICAVRRHGGLRQTCCSTRTNPLHWTSLIKFLAWPNSLDSFIRLNHWTLSCTIPFDWSFSPPLSSPISLPLWVRLFLPLPAPHILFVLLSWVDGLTASQLCLLTGALYSYTFYVSLLSLAALRLVSGILHVSLRPRSGQVALTLQT